MTQKIFRRGRLCLIVWMVASGVVFGVRAAQQETNDRSLTVHLQEAFDAKVSLTPFEGVKAINPIAEVSGVKAGETAVIKIPGQYLPGDFVLKLDYRAKAGDHPYPAERIIYVNDQDIEIFVNPPYINNNDKTRFNAEEKENTVYSAFVKENSDKRMPIELLKQFLLSYDRSNQKFYRQGIKEFEGRRQEYNAWLKEQAKKYKELYVSRLFQFQYVPSAEWQGKEEERVNQLIKNYFDGIDFGDPLIIRTHELARFMDGYMGLYGVQAKTEELRDALFTQAGRAACEKASKGDPKVYGWMVDYFYKGYETYHIDTGINMLNEHINNPNCLTSKKQQIITRMEGMDKLAPGALAPDFVIVDNQGSNFEFHKWKGKAVYKLLLFWSGDCESCQKLVNKLAQWYNEAANKEKIDVVAINLDETENAEQRWKTAIATIPDWEHMYVKEGVNSPIARDYAILSTPVMFLVESQSNIIVSVPDNLEELIEKLSAVR